ncbi:hypothetical protein [Halotia branconii]|uniref:Uncharacterized protein n=1 Tax=Halotia branconii CENA392 TaxID=1539056 RepID=A0AAJ6PCS9_9CYAN|nr:hypothetical protein [Halotia branconii]WGV29202.1 hypothetical protein QI031_30845 [Halotia branconii CENA392]
MGNDVALTTGKLYLFRGVQLRYSHERQHPEQARYVFTDSKGQRRELRAQIVRREVQEIREFGAGLYLGQILDKKKMQQPAVKLNR